MKKSIINLILTIISSLMVFSYSADNFQYPPGIKWSRIQSPHFILIYPSKLNNFALKVSNLLESRYDDLKFKSDSKHEKFKIFLNNLSNISNGYIQLAPKKGEFFLTPPQSMFLGNSQWIEGLSIHEGRHIAQFSFLNSGFTRFAGRIFGEIGRSMFSFLSVPQWFWEGDAVRSETILTNGGRGRVSQFNMGLRTILLNNRQYSYAKSYLSSYRDFVPDIYRLGYYISSYVYRKYPPETWEKVLKNSSMHSYNPFIFSQSLKKFTGKSLRKIYKDSMGDIKNFWKREFDNIIPTPFNILSPPADEWTYYSSPKTDKNGNIFAQKISLSSPSAIYRIDNSGTEKRLFRINRIENSLNPFSLSTGKIVWSEIRRDPRWGKKDYAEIVLFDIKKNRIRRLTRKTRFFSPSLSPDAKKIVTVEQKGVEASRLVTLEVISGKIIKKFLNEEGSFISTPDWSEENRVVYVEEKFGKKRISILNTINSDITHVLPYSYENLYTPLIYNDFVIYRSDRSGIDNIYAISITSGKKFRITSARFGAFFPTVDKHRKRLIYCDYDINGSRVVSVPLDRKRWTLIANDLSEGFLIDKPADIDKKNFSWNSNNVSKKFSIGKYNKLKDLLNFHSRIIDPSTPDPGFIFISDNMLNTLTLNTGVRYNLNEREPTLFLGGIYSGLFPKIHFSFYRRNRSTGSPDNLKWLENEVRAGVEIPLNLSKGVDIRHFSVRTDFSSMKISDLNSEKSIENGTITSLMYNMRYSSFKISSKRDIIPRSGFFIDALYRHTPFRGFYKGSLFSLSAGIIMPGFGRNQQFFIKGGYEYQDPVNFLFASRLNFPRGYKYLFHRSLSIVSSDYIFPISYPDLALGEILYIKRVRGDLFLDMGRGITNNSIALYRSAGLELKIDFNLFSIPVELFGGCRMTYSFDNSTFSVEPLFFEIGF